VLHPDFAAALYVEKQRQCPCGALAGRRHGLCRKCEARAAWRRRATATKRRSSRRLTVRRVRHLTRRIIGATALLWTTKGAEN
jgi:hypothetical protein